MKKLFYQPMAILAILGCAQFAAAQTTAETLQKAVEEYNGLREYEDGLVPASVTAEHLTIVKTRMEKGIAMLDKVINEGNADQVKAARYFKNNFKYEYGFVLGMKGENHRAYEILKEIERDFTAYAPSDFPMRYAYFGKDYVINWDNFAPTQAEYFTGMAEIAFNTSKYEEALRFSRLSLNHPSTSDWYKYIALNKLIEVYEKNNSLLSQTEYLDFALESVKSYDKLDETSKQSVEENNYPTAARGSDILIARAKQDHSAAVIQRCATAAPIAAKYQNSQSSALKLMEMCYRNDHDAAVEFHWVAVDLAKVMEVTERDRAVYVGTAALDKIAAKVAANDCESLPKIAEGYRRFSNTAKAAAIEERQRKCVAEQLAERNRQDELRRRQEELDRKQQHRANHPFNIYLGFNLVPVLTKPEKMDFGGHMDLRGRRVAHSFGYSIINVKHDIYSASEKWDGYRAFYALKVFGKSLHNQVAYMGFYLGYAEKDFMPLTGQVTSKTNPIDSYSATLIPHDKQYDLLWNSGAQALGKGVGFDFWFGMGASYHQLSYDEVDLETHEITGHDFFESRDKKESITIQFRLGISIGLNVGRKRD